MRFRIPTLLKSVGLCVGLAAALIGCASDEPENCALLARSFVLGKIGNTRTVLLRAIRDYPGASGEPDLRRATAGLSDVLRRAEREFDLDRLRGLEGEAAHTYFSVLNDLIVAQKDDFRFRSRTRRPPMDNVNALPSFLYTLLTHDACAALEVGIRKRRYLLEFPARCRRSWHSPPGTLG